MFEKVFRSDEQKKMKEYFLNLSQKGSLKNFPSKKEIKVKSGEEFGIVTRGKVGESFISPEGGQKELFFLVPGEIFGETDCLENTEEESYVYAIESSEVSFLSKRLLFQELKDNPYSHHFFYHSLFRKYQVTKHQLLNLVFRDSFRNICDTLMRIAVLESGDGNFLKISTTHQHLADLIGCSRITVTKTLNYLKENGVVKTEKKSIEITDPEKLINILPPK